MKVRLPAGVPKLDDYSRVINSERFRSLDVFSHEFLRKQKRGVGGYKWCKDPLHQWSRIWEYSFALSQIEDFLGPRIGSKIRILDAGSGFTFFPFFLSSTLGCEVRCCDSDPSLRPIFNEIHSRESSSVDFDNFNLDSLGYADDCFDIVYSISVLEHTLHHNEILRELKRVVKSEGLVVISFDISLDSKTELDVESACNLLSRIDEEFKPLTPIDISATRKDLQLADILTTEKARSIDRRLLPWRMTLYSVMSDLRHLRIPRAPFANLSVYCGAWTKPFSGDWARNYPHQYSDM